MWLQKIRLSASVFILTAFSVIVNTSFMDTSSSYFGAQLVSNCEASSKPRIMPSSAPNSHRPSHVLRPAGPGRTPGAATHPTQRTTPTPSGSCCRGGLLLSCMPCSPPLEKEAMILPARPLPLLSRTPAMAPPSLVCRLQSYEQGHSPCSGLAAAGVLSLETREDVTPQVSWLCCARPSGKTE